MAAEDGEGRHRRKGAVVDHVRAGAGGTATMPTRRRDEIRHRRKRGLQRAQNLHAPRFGQEQAAQQRERAIDHRLP